MVDKFVLFIVGFDEKLVIRSGFNIGLRPGDTALLIYSFSGGEYEKSKVQNAVKLVREVFKSAGINVKELVIDAKNFGEDVASVVRALRETSPRSVVVSLGSGMRYLGIVALHAALIYRKLAKGIEVLVHVAREDGLYDVVLNAETLRLSIGPSELRMICLVQTGVERDVLVKRAVETMKKSHSTVYSLLGRMVSRGLVELREDTVALTPLGEALAKALCGG